MAVLAELRYPTTTAAKVTSSILALALLVFVSLATISGVLLYQILHPPRNTGNFDLGVMMGHPSEVDFTLDDGQKREGWFFPVFAVRRPLFCATATNRSVQRSSR